MGLLQVAPIERDVEGAAIPIPAVVREAVKAELARFFWRWYFEHERDVLLRRKVLFFSLSITVKDLRPLFVTLFGEVPLGALSSGVR